MTISEKLDKIYETKLQIKSAIGTDSDVFEDYPGYIRSMGGGGVSYAYLDERLSYYVETEDLENMSYATQSYVADYVAEHGGGGSTVIDENIIPKETDTYSLGNSSYMYKSAYVSYLYMAENHSIFDTGTRLCLNFVNGGFRFNDDSFWALGNKSLGVNSNKWTDAFIVTTYSTNVYSDNTYTSYINSYYVNNLATQSYVADYVAEHGGGESIVIDENIIPKETDSYSLGSSSYYYNTVFTNRLQGNSSVNIRTNNNNRASFTNSTFRPMLANYDLGSTDYPWKNTYTTYINSYAVTDFATKSAVNAMFSYDSATGTLTITTLS